MTWANPDSARGMAAAAIEPFSLTTPFAAQTSSRPSANIGGSFASRRGHSNQLSISDESHHVTEAIGTLYGDEDDSGSDNGRPELPRLDVGRRGNERPLSFIGGSSAQEQIWRPKQQPAHQEDDPRKHLLRSQSDMTPGPSTSGVESGSFRKVQTLPTRSISQRSQHSFEHGPKSPGSPVSPQPSLRDFQADGTGSQFPLTNINNPGDIAQELSNLQALRRMSMDVGAMIDPDMPSMSLSSIPAIAPSGDDDEGDPSRLLWVPAGVHPELAPTEFQTFLEKRVQSIRRRSGESRMPIEDDLQRSESGASLSPSSSLSPGSIRRQKSKLSRQIDNSGGKGANGYVDGAERLERQRSVEQKHQRELSLDDLVKDPAKAVQQLAKEAQDLGPGTETTAEDKPILPMAPGMGLRRSTRTTYRKGGSLRSGGLSSRRGSNRQLDRDSSDPGALPAMPDAPPGHSLSRVQSEPISDNFSRPNRSAKRENRFTPEPAPPTPAIEENRFPNQQDSTEPPQASNAHDKRSLGASQATPASNYQPLKVERVPDQQYGRYNNEHDSDQRQRADSQSSTPKYEPETPEPAVQEPPPRSSRRAGPPDTPTNQQSQPKAQPQYTSKSPAPPQRAQNLHDSLAAHAGSSTSDMTFIPTLNQDDKRSDKKSKRDDDAGSISSTKSSSSGWKWFKSGDDKKEKKEEAKKSKTKALVERAQDNVRLDVIQNSIEKTAPKSRERESVVLDRDNIDSKLQEERKKDGSRKSDGKKDKDGSIFSSIFGGSKRKEEKEKSSKKSQQHLRVPEEPAYVPLQPDVDYHWTRFPLLEERAIYRMAHIKLANPRRSLLSQVLLSNFMYSYLAIVQAMHPQMNVPTSPQQKRLEEEAKRKQQEQEYLAQQQMQDDQDSALDQYDYDYHRAAVQYADSGNGQVDYVDDAQIYEDEHGRDHRDDYGYGDSDGYGQGAKEYYQYHGNGDEQRRHDGRDDMW